MSRHVTECPGNGIFDRSRGVTPCHTMSRDVTERGKMYNKLFSGILDSTIWLEDNATRIVWITFLAAMDDDGFVRFGAEENVARRANISLDEAKIALAKLEGPDERNPSQDNEGRRIERVSGGFYVINAKKYRKISDREDERARNRERKRKERQRRHGPSQDVTDSPGHSVTCHGVSRDVTKSTASEAEAEADTEEREGNARAPAAETDAVRPTMEEANAYAEKIGLVRWRSEDEWLKQEAADPPWKGVGSWTKHWNRVLRWWIDDNRPKSRPNRSTNGSNNRTGGFSRNGEFNAARVQDYADFTKRKRAIV